MQSWDYCQTCGDLIDAAMCGTCGPCYDKREEQAKMAQLNREIDNILLEEDKREWIVDCGACSAKTIVTFKEACEDGCPVCCSRKISIYHEKNAEKQMIDSERVCHLLLALDLLDITRCTGIDKKGGAVDMNKLKVLWEKLKEENNGNH